MNNVNNLKILSQKLNALNSNSYTLNEKYHGQIFKIETKVGTTKKGVPYQQWYFFVQDQSGAIILNAAVWNLNNRHNTQRIDFCNSLQVGDQVSFSGQAKKDHFSKHQDWNIDVSTNWKLDLVKTGHQPLMSQQQLSAEQVPHIEFLAKSKFSNHDGLMSPSDLIKANLQLGRKVIALTDWQTSQGFPELQNTIEAHNTSHPVQEQIEQLYGMIFK